MGFAPRQAQQHVLGVGGVNIVVPTARIERDIRNKISGFIWGWIITGIVVFILAIGGVVFFFWIRAQMNATTAAASAAPSAGTGAPQVASWDGKAPYMCAASQVVTIKGTTATLSSGPAVSALGACQLTLEDVNITAPDGIQAMGTAKVTVKGGSIKSTGNAIQAMGGAEVDVQGAKITGKTSALGAAAKITGVK
jgi:phage baseplate assembly protein gpV